MEVAGEEIPWYPFHLLCYILPGPATGLNARKSQWIKQLVGLIHRDLAVWSREHREDEGTVSGEYKKPYKPFISITLCLPGVMGHTRRYLLGERIHCICTKAN